MTKIYLPEWPWQLVRGLARDRGVRVWPVGGVVRDALLGRPIHDWDFADFYLLLKSDISWVNDGTRYSGDPGVRNWFFTRLEAILTDLNLTFQIIEGKDWQTRKTLAKTIVCKYLYKCT